MCLVLHCVLFVIVVLDIIHIYDTDFYSGIVVACRLHFHATISYTLCGILILQYCTFFDKICYSVHKMLAAVMIPFSTYTGM